MEQVVDFYEKLEPEKTLPKSLVWIGASLCAVLAVYAIWTVVLLAEQRGLEDKLVQMKSSNKMLEGKMQLEVEKSKQYEPDVLSARLSYLRKNRHEKQKLVTNLRNPRLTNIRGFSGVLTALARQHRRGVAIERIEVTENGTIFSMAGEVENPLDLPEYILRLGEEEAFWEMSFETIKIAEVETKLNFELRSWSKI